MFMKVKCTGHGGWTINIGGMALRTIWTVLACPETYRWTDRHRKQSTDRHRDLWWLCVQRLHWRKPACVCCRRCQSRCQWQMRQQTDHKLHRLTSATSSSSSSTFNQGFLRVNLELHKAAGGRSSTVRIEALKGLWCGEGMSPSPLGRGLETGCAPSPEKFLISGLNMVSFAAFWVVFLLQLSYLFYTQNSIIWCPSP